MIYQQVEAAIKGKLHVLTPRPNHFLDPWTWRYPVGIEHGNILMRDSDCGLAKPVMTWTTDQWRERVSPEGDGLYRKVGMWDFVPADDPAVDCIRWCHSAPESAGRELYRLRQEIEALQALPHTDDD